MKHEKYEKHEKHEKQEKHEKHENMKILKNMKNMKNMKYVKYVIRSVCSTLNIKRKISICVLSILKCSYGCFIVNIKASNT
jgi:3-hydroxyacyl-CoA dehydrogenase